MFLIIMSGLFAYLLIIYFLFIIIIIIIIIIKDVRAYSFYYL
jgi:hypothetical protein